MSDEKLYTLAEAKIELNREECELRGHDYEIHSVLGVNAPTYVSCSRCGKTWSIPLKDQV